MNDTPAARGGDGAWARLRRRKVVQWSIAYVAGAWALLQGLEYLSTTFEWSRHIQQLATIGLIVGLPIVLVLAWYHGDRGEQRFRATELTLITLLFLVGGGILRRYQNATDTSTATSPATASLSAPGATPPEAPPDHKSIAVLPFVNMSSDPEQEYFSDGLSEELLNLLAKLPGLRVIGRTSSFQFKGKNEDLRMIGEKLGAAHLLEGSVRKAGNKVRITAQLVRADDGSHLWSQTYDRTLEDIFAVQDDIAGQVVTALEVTLLGGEQATTVKSRDVQAYNLYLQGRHFSQRQSPDDAKRAIHFLEQSLERDASYAPAWVELANVYVTQADYGWTPSADAYAKARQAVERALAIDPKLATAHSALGWIQSGVDYDWAAAEASLQTALALEPDNAEVLLRSGYIAASLGRTDEGLKLIRKSLELDPLRLDSLDYLSYGLLAVGRYEEAESLSRRMFELDPNRGNARYAIGLPLLLQGNLPEALHEMEAEDTESWRLFGLSLVYHSLGRKDESDKVLALLKDKYAGEMAFRIGEVHAWRGENDLAFEWLERAYDQQEGALTDIKLSQFVRRVSDDPRYKVFLRKMKFPA